MPKKSNVKPKSVIVLNALLSGLKIDIAGGTYIYNNNALCLVGDSNMRGEVYMKADYLLSDFIQLCEQISDDNIFLIAADVALNKMKEDGVKF